ncbi:MAG: NADH:flavin oxidoreductase [Dehalococcoidia bacterium]|nr:NADH:flavin oxidoreductase [Dehalococcoidia bacterium]
MHKVLQPASLAGMALRNRLIRSATWDSTADENGAVTDRSVAIYENLAAGGVGLIVTGYAFVSRHGQAVFGQYGAYGDEMIPGLRRLAQAAHRHGAKIAAQIVHAGAFSTFLARTGQEQLAPSPIEIRHRHREITEEDIEKIIGDFAKAAVRVRDAGFDAVQLHGAHGYLMSQFLSTITNLRKDRWGLTPEDRRRFHVETVRRVRAAVGSDFPLMIKFGVMDDNDGGATLEEGIAALQAMAEVGLDAAEISGGIGSGKRAPIQVVADDQTEVTYYRERAARAKAALDIPIAVVVGIRCLETAEDIIQSGDADFVALSRPLIRQPGLVNKWLAGDLSRATCISCAKCLTLVSKGDPLECGEDRRIREEG